MISKLILTFLILTMCNHNIYSIKPFTNYRLEDYSYKDKTNDLLNFYIDNNIHPSSVNPPIDGQVLYYSGVSNYLSNLYGLNSWLPDLDESFEVANIYGVNPINVEEADADIAYVKEELEIEYEYLGCGPLALYGQLDYLIRGMNYYEFEVYDPDYYLDKRVLIRDVLTYVDTIPAESYLGNLFNMEEGTLTLPYSFIQGANDILEKYNLQIQKERVINNNTEYYYDTDSQIVVRGDALPSMDFFSTKISNIKESIDRGMPLIVWTFGDSENDEYKNHYMNIYGYETWSAYDQNNMKHDHLMLKIRVNWTDYNGEIYMDSEYLNAYNCGFIYFDEIHRHIGISPDELGFPCSYNNIDEVTYFNENEMTVDIARLRTGYVNHFNYNNEVDSQRLVLSSRRNQYQDAYLRMFFDYDIINFTVGLCKWSTYEFFSYYDGSYLRVDSLGNGRNWDYQSIDLYSLSSAYTIPSTIRYDFTNFISTNDVRICVHSGSQGYDRNLGRIIVRGISVIYEEIIDTSYVI